MNSEQKIAELESTIERYEFCLQLLIYKIREVTDGKITLDDFIQFRAGMESGIEGDRVKQ
jgi:hypothetical protein